MADSTPWTLVGFLEALDRWIEGEHPDEDLRLVVTAWVFTRHEDPYRGVRREPGFENLWFGAVPRTLHGKHQVVVGSYWVEETTRTVRCDSIATLSLPL